MSEQVTEPYAPFRFSAYLSFTDASHISMQLYSLRLKPQHCHLNMASKYTLVPLMANLSGQQPRLHTSDSAIEDGQEIIKVETGLKSAERN